MKHIFIEADSAVQNKVSGIGYTVRSLLKEFDTFAADKKCKVTAIVPYGKTSYIRENFQHIRIRQLLPGYKYINALMVRTSLPLPVDLFFGRGVYVFPNYKNWFVPFSKSVTFFHDMAFSLHPETVQPKNLKYLQQNIRRWASRTTRIIAISQSTKSDIVQILPEHKSSIEVIHLGVNHGEYYPRSQSECSNIVQKYSLPTDFFLFVGNIEPRKNIMMLLQAYELVYEKFSKTCPALVLVGGNGWLNEEILEKIRDLQGHGLVVVRPKRYVTDADLPQLFSAARAFVFPALYEGFGLPIVQAMACKTPVILGRNSSLEEVAGSAGVYFNENTPQSLAKVMTDVFKLSTDQLIQIEKAGLTWSKKFTWQRTAERLLNTINKL